jgi:hypothetical protein
MKRPVLACVVLAVALFVVGCGGSSSNSTTKPKAPAGSKVVSCKTGGLRATSVDCASARKVMNGWEASEACALAQGESRGACSISSFRCQSVRTGKGVSVSCARPGGDVSFIAKAGMLKKSD